MSVFFRVSEIGENGDLLDENREIFTFHNRHVPRRQE